MFIFCVDANNCIRLWDNPPESFDMVTQGKVFHANLVKYLHISVSHITRYFSESRCWFYLFAREMFTVTLKYWGQQVTQENVPFNMSSVYCIYFNYTTDVDPYLLVCEGWIFKVFSPEIFTIIHLIITDIFIRITTCTRN